MGTTEPPSAGLKRYDSSVRSKTLNSKAVLTDLGKVVRRRREVLGLSQAVLATKAGLHLNVIGRTERGVYNPSIIALLAIAEALGISIVDLLKGAA